MTAIKKATILEVGPRDGFQNIKTFIPTETKIKIIRGILDSGVKNIQITSFVSPKAIPQMRDSKEVAENIMKDYTDVTFNALVPNLFGAKNAAKCGIKEISYVISVSESHNLKNNNRTHEQSFEELKRVIEELPELDVVYDVATAFGCPFEGETELDKLLEFIERGVRLGLKKVNLNDTIGVAYPTQVEEFIKAVRNEFPEVIIGLHIHDTRNMGMVNTWVGIQNGVDSVHASIGGLGGCPFAPGASGNICTEDLVYMLDRCGIETGIDFNRLLKVSRYTKERINNGCFSGHHLNIPEEITYTPL